MTVSAKLLDFLFEIGSNTWIKISNIESFQNSRGGHTNYIIRSNETGDTLLWIN
jgi:hypothetical protein